ncbi:16S rRNA (adenine(1518)-N(6)/adenine(1519)-N(6))-dimethyltransferase RsmA [Lachnospiraceae bacterium JLR.KK008]
MAHLGKISSTVEILNKYHFNFQKRYGQNFLVDSHILDNIVQAAEVTEDDCVLEIGPGIGTMTQYLAESAREVIAVEIDRFLIPILKETLADYNNVSIINEDILKVNLKALAEEKNGGRPIKVVANLPYYITTPIIMGLFESCVPLESITVMVQKEVAERMQAGPGTKDYGALSLAVQYYARPEVMMDVSPNCFIPRPNVGSAVVRLNKYKENPVQVADETYLFSLIRAAFGQRRKTLANSLGNAGSLEVTKEQIQDALKQMELSATVRGEALTLSQFACLSDILKGKSS